MEKVPGIVSQQLRFDVPLARVWQALTDAKEVVHWLAGAAEFEATPDALGYVQWHAELPVQCALRIEEAEPMRRFAWRWTPSDSAPYDWSDATLVEWHLLPEAHHLTRVEMHESGFSDSEHAQRNAQQWDRALAELVAYLQPRC